MGRSKSLHTAERTAAILDLHKAGLTDTQIGEQLGVSQSYVTRLRRQAIQALVLDPSSEIVQTQLLRLNALLVPFWALALRGDVKAAEVCLKIIGMVSKITGIEAPQRVEVTQVPREAAAAIAADFGLDPDEVIAEAERIVRDHGARAGS